jgi:glycosyltransferase involved in cell wall biosynthesis
MRVAHVDAETGFSGGETQVFLLIEGLRERGYEELLVCPPKSRSDAEARRRGIHVHPVRMSNDLHVGAIIRLRSAFARFRPDIVHLHTGRATWLGGLAARMLSIPTVTTRRMDKPVRRGWRQRVTYGPLVTRVVAVSCVVQEELLAGGVSPEKLSLIHDSVDMKIFASLPDRNTARSALCAGANATVLLTVGALFRRKGFDVLLEALSQTQNRHLVLWIAGDGPERGSLEAQAKRLGLSERVLFLGRREDVPNLLAACDVFVLASRREGLGVSALEAMAARRPVVATRVGGLAEAVVDERTGLLVPPSDPRPLARAVDRLAADPQLCLRLGDAGPSRVSEGFLAAQMVDAYDELYRSVCEERKDP